MEKRILLPEPMRALIGGLEPKALTSLYGAPGTGKTNICLLAALECVRKDGRVVFMDTEGGFSVNRMKQLDPDVDFVLGRIELLEPKDFEEQGKLIRALRHRDTDLVIVDSMAALYRLEYANPKAESRHVLEANRELSLQLSILSSMAREKNIPVLITTHTFRNWETKEREIIGGDSVKYWSKAIVYFEKTSKTSERKATVIKHTHLPEGGNVKFMLVNEGIRPSGFKLF
jgi:DNA repair protein RadB